MTHPTDADVEAMALLPCPFCGGDAYVWSERRVICGKCDCEGPECGDDDGLQKNIAAWNRRAIPPTLATGSFAA